MLEILLYLINIVSYTEIQACEVAESQIGNTSEADEVPVQIPITDATPVEGSDVEAIPVENGSINISNGQSSATPEENTTKGIYVI